MRQGPKVRMLAACFGLSAIFTVFSYRLVQLQVVKHEEYAALAAEKHVNRQVIYAERGTIQDVNGEVLADNEPVKTVVADGALVKDPAALAALLAPALAMDREKLREMLSCDKRYIIVKRHVPESAVNDLDAQLRRSAMRGIYFEQDSARIYPNGPMLCHVLGFMDYTHEGRDGIEKAMDNYLRGHDGFRYTERDRTGKEIVPYRGQERPARAGCNVRLTIDMGLQNIVETELDAAVKKFRPESAVVILMRPKTGEILALANRPNYDVNNVGNSLPADMKNRAITDMVEPGSTFKIVTASAALNEHVVDPDTIVFCENGVFNYANRPLHDHGHGFADLSVNDILMRSSNIGAAKLALRTGDQKFYEYIRRFGFGERTGIVLPGEIAGQVKPPSQWQKIDITRIAMGHSICVTALQSICSMSAIANGGHLMMPQIVHEIVDGDGTTVASYPPVEIRRVVSDKVAAQVREALKNVVSEYGTAVGAEVNGFVVAGKTGTAEKSNPDGRGYLAGKYVVSFIGFLPADNPEFVGLVLLDDAKVSAEMNYGGQVAGPIFAHIADKAARYLNLEPHPEETSGGIILTQSQAIH